MEVIECSASIYGLNNDGAFIKSDMDNCGFLNQPEEDFDLYMKTLKVELELATLTTR
jgi:hypothetical protein